MTRVDVVSSNVKAIGYDAQTRTLEIEYRGLVQTHVYQYTPVSAELHFALMNSESIGRAVNALIKGDLTITATNVTPPLTTEVF